MYTLVICEKPDAARRIALALGSPKEQKAGGVSVFDVACGGSRYVVASAIGHLYGLADASASRSVYPVLDLEWGPVAKNARAAASIKVISELAKKASAFVHACDFDQEGEVIGHSILQYTCGGKYGGSMRAKFSTLTDEEIVEAFANLGPPNAGMARAGRLRHLLDFLYGVNLSRALSQSFKSSKGGYQSLSIGRVQGPALAFVVDREMEVRLHIPDPYWAVAARLAKAQKEFRAAYVKPRINSHAEATAIHDACAQSAAAVTGVDRRRVVLRPPTPFNIGDLQREAYRMFKLSPGYTMSIAENLYLRALISYPRTSSQKLPPSIGYSKIISRLAMMSAYGRHASILLSKGRLAPNQGKMSDPAHPAVYPTGIVPRSRLGGLEFKVYDLIVKRFLATFGDSAATERTSVAIDIAGHQFLADGAALLYEGWMAFYRPYVAIEQHELPPMQAGDRLENLEIDVEAKFTQPPRRYNQASLLARMESEELGTKATRADIIATLFKRKYVAATRDGIEPTDLGFAVIESMKEHVPLIISTELTRAMEEQLEKVETGKTDSLSIIEPAVNTLVESLALLLEKEIEVGEKVGDAAISDRMAAAAIGRCPVCKSGQLRVIRAKKTKKRFVGCSNYSEGGCKATAPLPQRGAIRATAKPCGECGWPIVGVIFARRAKQWRICVNMSCPSKKIKAARSL